MMKTAQTGLHSLPPELKEQIARCCAEQDALLASALKKVIPEKALVYLIDTTRFAALKSCVCDITPANSAGALPDFDYARDRIPGLKVATASVEVDSLTQHVADWIHQRDAEQAPERADYREKPTSPQPLQHLPKKRTRSRSASDSDIRSNTCEWYRSASDAQDSDALVQIGEVLESVDIRKTVMGTWAGSPDSENA